MKTSAPLALLINLAAAAEWQNPTWDQAGSGWDGNPSWTKGYGGHSSPCSISSSASAVPSFDVAVVGGGFSGLSAAENLIEGGASVAVFEARDRVGGRVLNVHLQNGGVQEVGAEYVGPTQDRVLAYAASLGLTTYKTYNNGSDLYYNGTSTPYSSTGLPPIDDAGLSEVINGVVALDDLAAALDVQAPWEAPNAQELDSQTFATWLDGRNLSASARSLFEVTITSVWSVEPGEVSLLYIVSYIAAAGNATQPGNLLRLITTADGAQDSRINGGTQSIAIKLAERIRSQKGTIDLSTPIRRISLSNDTSCYELYSDNPHTPVAVAKDVVVAMSPPMAFRINYDPLLPPSRDQLTQRMPMGAIGKAIAIYDKPFWRSADLSGQVVSTDNATVIRASFDNSPADASYGAIMGFIESDEMRRLDALSEEEVKSLIVADFVTYFGEQASAPTEFVLQRWDHEEWSRGAPVAYGPPGVLTKYGKALRTPVGGIHWAGTETSDYWVGYMDGALRSGERVAKEILTA